MGERTSLKPILDKQQIDMGDSCFWSLLKASVCVDTRWTYFLHSLSSLQNQNYDENPTQAVITSNQHKRYCFLRLQLCYFFLLLPHPPLLLLPDKHSQTNTKIESQSDRRRVWSYRSSVLSTCLHVRLFIFPSRFSLPIIALHTDLQILEGFLKTNEDIIQKTV